MVVVVSGLAVASYGLVARVLFGDKLFGLLAVPTIRPFGPFVSKNHFAGYVEMAALLALGLAIGLRDEARRESGPLAWVESRAAPRVVLAYGAAAVLTVAVLVSLSRGGAVSLVAGVATVVLLRSTRARGARRRSVRGLTAFTALALAAAVLFVVPPEARERLASIGDGRRDASTAFRATVWRDTLRLSATSPLIGHGLGTFVDALPRFKSGVADVLVEHVENDYLELLAECGVVGLALGIGALVALGWPRAPRSAEPSGRLRRGLTLGSSAALAAMAVHSLLDFNLRIPSNALLFALLAAIVLAARPPSRARSLRGPGLAVLGALLVALAASSPRSNTLKTLLPVQSFRAGSASTPLRLQALENDVKDHLNRRPGDARAWVWLGWSRAELGAGPEGAAIAAYGASLDPQRRRLGEVAASLETRGTHPRRQ
jgi:O-antigen ligase